MGRSGGRDIHPRTLCVASDTSVVSIDIDTKRCERKGYAVLICAVARACGDRATGSSSMKCIAIAAPARGHEPGRCGGQERRVSHDTGR